jgi:MYXO-CTERM domain-containing protein
MHTAVEWVESASGLDITPCHDPDGTWNPSIDCRFFPKEPRSGHGTWPTCGEGPVGGFSEICGDPAGGPDDAPPIVDITAPETGTVFDSDPMTGNADVTIGATADDGDGWGVQEVRLVINDNEVPNGADTAAPYEWPAAFPPGQYTAYVIALDYAGNEAESEKVYFGVDMDAPDPPDDGGTGGEDGTGSGGSSGGGSGGADGGDGGAGEDGCGCSSDATPRPWWTVLALGGLVAWRRRRGA